ncbi:hydroxycarboxylic acid receptor 2-like [Myripristis murdjan]|uniref:hydroxycarboxylic acid receptor 2-like n=1 Tax=Myripristis murdjan TaxID=586833 RepID=UPI0011762026|nr:hydroxycarboxylic acid receptor 2-like [Myripristis murdjan]
MQCNFNATLLISVLPPLLLIEFVLGVLGNGLALWIFCFHLKPWKSSTVFLFNLALTDFMLNFALPFRAAYYFSGASWGFGNAFCNICLFMLALNRSGSTIFLMVIAVDRYMRVVHPHHPVNYVSVTKAACGAAVLWLFTISLTAHTLTIPWKNTTYCESFIVQTEPSVRLTWHKTVFIFSFYMPLAVILYCTFQIIGHLRGRPLAQHPQTKRALCFITIVVMLFIICFLPSNIIQLWIWFKTQELPKNIPLSEFCANLEDLQTAFYITIILTYLNSMLDPLVYYFSSPAFKNICRRALHQAKVTVESSDRKIRETGSQAISQM